MNLYICYYCEWSPDVNGGGNGFQVWRYVSTLTVGADCLWFVTVDQMLLLLSMKIAVLSKIDNGNPEVAIPFGAL